MFPIKRRYATLSLQFLLLIYSASFAAIEPEIVNGSDYVTTPAVNFELLGSCDLKIEDKNYLILLVKKFREIDVLSNEIVMELNLYSFDRNHNFLKFDRTLWVKPMITSPSGTKISKWFGDVAVLTDTLEVVVAIFQDYQAHNTISLYKIDLDANGLNNDIFIGKHEFISPVNWRDWESFRVETVELVRDHKSLEIHAIGVRGGRDKITFKIDDDSQTWRRVESMEVIRSPEPE